MENNRWPNQEVLNVFTENNPDTPYQKSYQPRHHRDAAKAEGYGHRGTDFLVIQDFVETITQGKRPFIDVYQAMDMTLPGIIGYRSACQGNIVLEVPDFRKENVRKKYEDDHWSPDPRDEDIPGQPCPSILGDIEIADSVHKLLEKRRGKAKVSLEKAYKID
jgi:hypothetical protein